MRLSRANIPLASEDRSHSQAKSHFTHYNLAPQFWPRLNQPPAFLPFSMAKSRPTVQVGPNWDVLGMRATRSDSLILDGCWLPESAAVFRSDDMRAFRH